MSGGSQKGIKKQISKHYSYLYTYTVNAFLKLDAAFTITFKTQARFAALLVQDNNVVGLIVDYQWPVNTINFKLCNATIDFLHLLTL